MASLSGWLVERPAVVLGGIVLLSAALAAAFGAQITGYEPDELGYTHLAIGIAHSLSPITLSYGGGQRLNQLYPLLIAPWWGMFGNVTAFRITHIWNALLMASAAVPAYLLAREVIASRWAAYLSAALVAFAPWLTLSTTQLTEVAAYPACVWALLAMQRSLVAPSTRRDLVALLAIAIAAYGRLQLVVLAPVFVLAMLAHELGYGLVASRGNRVELRHAFERITRGHLVLSAIAVLGLLAGVPLLLSGKLASAAGFYGDTLSGLTLNAATFGLARSYIAFIALGLGVLPAALTLGLAIETFIAPVSRRVHAFCAIAATAVIVLTLQVAEISVRFNGATMQERYLFYIAPLLIVGGCAALLASRRPASVLLGGSVVLALIVGSTHYESQRTAFWYQISPGMASFYDWLRPAFAAAGGPRADPGASRQIAAGLVVLGIGVLLAVLARRLPRGRLLAGVGTLLVVFCVTQTTHALWRVVHGSSSGAGFGQASIANASWVDGHVPSGASVEQLLGNLGGLDAARQTWEDDTFWNRTLRGAYSVDYFYDPYLPTTRLSVDIHSGELRLAEALGSDRYGLTPSYLVVPSRGFPVEPVGRILAHSREGKLRLMRVSAPLRAAWIVSGISSDGWLRIDRSASLHLYSLSEGACAKVGLTFSLSALDPSSSRVTLTVGGGTTRADTLSPGQTRVLYARVCRSSGATPVLAIGAEQDLSTYTPLTPKLLRVTATPV